MLKLPILGMLLRKIAVARFTRTLGTLITSGVPILEGLSITARTSGNAVLEEALMRGAQGHRRRPHHRRSAAGIGVFPNMVTQMIGVGEATGAMDAMLQKIADFYEDEVDSATKDMLAMLEPVIIGLLGVMIGGIVISLYMPLFSMIAKLAGCVLEQSSVVGGSRRKELKTDDRRLTAVLRDSGLACNPSLMSGFGWPGWSRFESLF